MEIKKINVQSPLAGETDQPAGENLSSSGIGETQDSLELSPTGGQLHPLFHEGLNVDGAAQMLEKQNAIEHALHGTAGSKEEMEEMLHTLLSYIDDLSAQGKLSAQEYTDLKNTINGILEELTSIQGSWNPWGFPSEWDFIENSFTQLQAKIEEYSTNQEPAPGIKLNPDSMGLAPASPQEGLHKMNPAIGESAIDAFSKNQELLHALYDAPQTAEEMESVLDTLEDYVDSLYEQGKISEEKKETLESAIGALRSDMLFGLYDNHIGQFQQNIQTPIREIYLLLQAMGNS